MKRSAAISDCGRYRYALWRGWGPDAATSYATFVMLNPSTADANVDDPTIRRCIDFAKSWGLDGLYVVNLYALRATDPAELRQADHPIGPENDDRLRRAARAATANRAPLIAAWGANADPVRVRAVLAATDGATWSVLGLTQAGIPKHPLARGVHRIPDDTEPQPWRPQKASASCSALRLPARTEEPSADCECGHSRYWHNDSGCYRGGARANSHAKPYPPCDCTTPLDDLGPDPTDPPEDPCPIHGWTHRFKACDEVDSHIHTNAGAQSRALTSTGKEAPMSDEKPDAGGESPPKKRASKRAAAPKAETPTPPVQKPVPAYPFDDDQHTRVVALQQAASLLDDGETRGTAGELLTLAEWIVAGPGRDDDQDHGDDGPALTFAGPPTNTTTEGATL